MDASEDEVRVRRSDPKLRTRMGAFRPTRWRAAASAFQANKRVRFPRRLEAWRRLQRRTTALEARLDDASNLRERHPRDHRPKRCAT
jgi:hypothetical protein